MNRRYTGTRRLALGASVAEARAQDFGSTRRLVANAAKTPVDAEQNLVEVAVDVVYAVHKGDRVAIKKDVVPLDPERPVGSEHIFEADPHVAAVGVLVHRTDHEPPNSLGHGETLIDSAPTALDVEQG